MERICFGYGVWVICFHPIMFLLVRVTQNSFALQTGNLSPSVILLSTKQGHMVFGPKKFSFIALLFMSQCHDYRRPLVEQDPNVQDSGVVGHGLSPLFRFRIRVYKLGKILDVSTAEHTHVSSLCTFTFYKAWLIGAAPPDQHKKLNHWTPWQTIIDFKWIKLWRTCTRPLTAACRYGTAAF